jgi:predicted ATP-grasp superfamily ATP-dependent carboligase
MAPFNLPLVKEIGQISVSKIIKVESVRNVGYSEKDQMKPATIFVQGHSNNVAELLI